MSKANKANFETKCVLKILFSKAPECIAGSGEGQTAPNIQGGDEWFYFLSILFTLNGL